MPTAPTPPPTLDALPQAPSRQAPSTFRALMDAFLAAMVTYRTQLVALATWKESTAQEVYDNASDAFQSEQNAQGHQDAAEDAQAAAELAEANAQGHEAQALLHANAAGAASPIDLASSNIGDLLQVVDDGMGGKMLAMSAQRLENSVSFTGTTPALAIAGDQDFHGTLSGNTTFTFDVSGFGTIANNVIYFTLEITQDSTQRTITWPASVDWPVGTPPDAQAANTKALYAFRTRDGGTTWEGRLVGREFA